MLLGAGGRGVVLVQPLVPRSDGGHPPDGAPYRSFGVSELVPHLSPGISCPGGAGGWHLFYRLKRRGRPVTPAENMTAGEHQGPSMSRRTFLKGMAAAVPVAAAATSGLGNVVGESYLAVTKLPLSFPNLPDYLEGYRIGQISDSHIGLFFSPEDLKTAMERLAAEKVNRLEITGDLIDELSRLPQCRQVLMEGAALFPDGIDFCYGNHEYYRGLADITDMLESTPIRIVRNSHFCASPGGGRNLSGRSGRDNRPLYIAGTDFSFAPSGRLHDEQRRDYTQTALQGIPEGAFTILLAHNSAFIDEDSLIIFLLRCVVIPMVPSLHLSGL